MIVDLIFTCSGEFVISVKVCRAEGQRSNLTDMSQIMYL